MGDDGYIALASGLQFTSNRYCAVVFGHRFVI